MPIDTLSYSIACAGYLVLFVLAALRWERQPIGLVLLIAILSTAFWAVISLSPALHFYKSLNLFLIAESSRVSLWIIFLAALLDLPNFFVLRRFLVPDWRFFSILLSICLIFTALAGSPAIETNQDSALPFTNISIIILLVSAITGIALVEAIYRRTELHIRQRVKHICIGLGLVFVYDFFLFVDALLYQQANSYIWAARGLIHVVAVPLIAISTARNREWSLDIHVSRAVVAQSFTIIAAGIYLIITATIGYGIQFFSVTWGEMLQLLFFTLSGLSLIALLSSRKIRAHLRVFLGKHFFSHKYDYRQVWLDFTQTISVGEKPVPERLLFGLCNLVDSPGGSIWACKEDHRFSLIADSTSKEIMNGSQQTSITNSLLRTDIDQLAIHIKTHSDVVIFDKWRAGNLPLGDIPADILNIQEQWLAVPLQFDGDLVGIALLHRSDVVNQLNWEDNDLLKVAGNQAAGLLVQHLGDLQLMEAKQFEGFNKLSAYIVHDLKNILNQQSLIVSNAEKHKHNPEFIDDVIETIDNSVNRMHDLMEQLRSGFRDSDTEIIEIEKLLREVVGFKSIRQPAPKLYTHGDAAFVFGNLTRLTEVFGHIVQNAQEATGAEGKVTVSLDSEPDGHIIKIEDNGPGMTLDFIDKRLFRAFDTTKGLTGMGIGAFESREYIRSIGGDIFVYSQPNVSTCFKIVLPPHQE